MAVIQLAQYRLTMHGGAVDDPDENDPAQDHSKNRRDFAVDRRVNRIERRLMQFVRVGILELVAKAPRAESFPVRDTTFER